MGGAEPTKAMAGGGVVPLLTVTVCVLVAVAPAALVTVRVTG